MSLINPANQVDVFEAARIAFVIRFAEELDTRWEEHVGEASCQIVAAPITEKHRFLQELFDDLGDAVAAVVHKYFPSLLQVASANRGRLSGQSPIEWTEDQVRTQVCDFFGLDAEFDVAHLDPRNDSRVLATVERVTTGRGSLEDCASIDFALPRWVEVPHPLTAVLWSISGDPTEERRRYEASLESEKLSRDETLNWARDREAWIRWRIDQQIYEEHWDGIIEAGKNGVSVVDPDPSVPPEADGRPALLDRGYECEKYAEEMKRIKRRHRDGLSMPEIRKDYAQFSIWRAVEHLPPDDLDIFNRPRMWGPTSGYINGVLGKIYGKSLHTVNDWRKKYRKQNRSVNLTKRIHKSSR